MIGVNEVIGVIEKLRHICEVGHIGAQIYICKSGDTLGKWSMLGHDISKNRCIGARIYLVYNKRFGVATTTMTLK